MKNTEILAVLGGIPELESLEGAQVETLAALSTLASIPENTVLYREDELGTDLFFLISGLLESRLRVPSRQNMEEPFRTIKPGKMFGETAFLNSGRRGSTTVTRERSLVLRLDGERLKAACDDDHDIGYAIYRILGKIASEGAREATLELRNTIGSY